MKRLRYGKMLFILILLSAGCGPDGKIDKDFFNGLVRSTAQSINEVPGSCMMSKHGPLQTPGKWLPVKTSQSTKQEKCPEENLSIVELKGWILKIEDKCHHESEGPDLRIDLEIDTGAIAAKFGSDQEGLRTYLNKLVRVGNIYMYSPDNFARENIPISGVSSRSLDWHSVASPLAIHMEVWGWQKKLHSLAKPPDSWKAMPSTTCDIRDNEPVLWPFDPHNPWGDTPIKQGDYVVVYGALVTDNPHYSSNRAEIVGCGFLPEDCGEPDKLDVLRTWYGAWHCPNDLPIIGKICPDDLDGEKDELNPARWTEIHPPDNIFPLSPPPIKEQSFAVALLSEHCLFGPCKEASFAQQLELPKPTPGATLRVVELVSQEPAEGPNNGTIVFGNHERDAALNSGAKITITDLGQTYARVHIEATVRGEGGWGRPGRFKAVYRLVWENTNL